MDPRTLRRWLLQYPEHDLLSQMTTEETYEAGDYIAPDRTPPGLDLREVDFSKTTWHPGARLPGADLTRTSWLDTRLIGVDFTGSQLVEAKFWVSLLQGVIFDNCRLDQATFRRGTLRRGSFCRVNAIATHWIDWYMQDITLEEVDFTTSVFDHCTFEDVCFRRVVFTRCHFLHCTFLPSVQAEACVFTDCKGI